MSFRAAVSHSGHEMVAPKVSSWFWSIPLNWQKSPLPRTCFLSCLIPGTGTGILLLANGARNRYDFISRPNHIKVFKSVRFKRFLLSPHLIPRFPPPSTKENFLKLSKYHPACFFPKLHWHLFVAKLPPQTLLNFKHPPPPPSTTHIMLKYLPERGETPVGFMTLAIKPTLLVPDGSTKTVTNAQRQ